MNIKNTTMMKKARLFPLIGAIMLFTACSREEDNQLEVNQELYNVTFQLDAMSSNVTPMRAAATPIENMDDIVALDYKVFDGVALEQNKSYLKATTGIPKEISLSLPKGNYTIVVLAKRATAKDGNDVLYPGETLTGIASTTYFQHGVGKVLNAEHFYIRHQFTVGDSYQAGSLTLDRLVGKMRVKLADQVLPDWITDIKVDIANAPYRYTYTTDKVSTTASTVLTVKVTPEMRANPGKYPIEFFTMAQATPVSNMNITITASGATGTTELPIVKQVFGFGIERSKVTTISGKLLKGSNEWSIIINDEEWTENAPIEF